jgi:hypothetical protein
MRTPSGAGPAKLMSTRARPDRSSKRSRRSWIRIGCPAWIRTTIDGFRVRLEHLKTNEKPSCVALVLQSAEQFSLDRRRNTTVSLHGFEQVPVSVERDLDGMMPEPSLDALGFDSLLNPQRSCRMA